MKRIQLNPMTMVFGAVLVGAAAFAAGRSTSRGTSTATPSPVAETTSHAADPALPLDHPPMGYGGSASGLPQGHPHVDDPSALPLAIAESSLSWQAPARWQKAPNPSTMRLATFRIPHAPGDAEDAELSITQAGGSVDANAKRWIDQFDEAGQKTAKTTKKKINGLEITIVEVEGIYSGGMGKDVREDAGWALVGVIAATPGMPHFFKLTGPANTVKAARAEMDALVASLSTR